MNVHIASVVPGLEAATRVAAAGFVQPMTDALREDVDHHLAEGCLVQTFALDVRVLGFAIYRLFEFGANRLLYLAGIILDPEIQGQGLAARAIRLAALELEATHLALRTQSPRMWLVGARLAEGDWGTHPDRTIAPKLIALGEEISKAIDCSGVFPHLRGVYGGPLYGEKPTHHDAPLQAWWDEQCTFLAGDAVLCIGTLTNL